MQKIPTVFQRSEDRRSVIDKVTPGCEWALAGEGVATRKLDGTCVRIFHTIHGAEMEVGVDVRREVKPGKQPPEFFTPIGTDETTGKTVGWEPYLQSGFAKFIDEALGVVVTDDSVEHVPDPKHWPEGTYELCGPKINGNPEHLHAHRLLRHADATMMRLAYPVDFDGMRERLLAIDWEGVVWHHPDGRMAKLKKRDFR